MQPEVATECRMTRNYCVDWSFFASKYMAAPGLGFTVPLHVVRDGMAQFADDCDGEFLYSLNASNDQVQRAVGVKRHNFQVHVAIVGGYRDPKFAEIGDLVCVPNWMPDGRVRIASSFKTSLRNPLGPIVSGTFETEEYENKPIRWMDDILTDFWQRVS